MINKDTKLAEVLSVPNSGQILSKYEVPCITCPRAKAEMDKLTIGQICEMYGLDLDNLLKELNEEKS